MNSSDLEHYRLIYEHLIALGYIERGETIQFFRIRN